MSRLRIRTLKPEVWAHEKIARLREQERLLFVVLVTMADDEGRLRELPRAIIGHGYPHDRISERQITSRLAALERELLIVRYGCGRERYIAIRGWKNHQRIDKPRTSQYPAPDGFSALGQGSLDSLSQNSGGEFEDASTTDRGPGRDQGPGDPPTPAGRGSADSIWQRVRDSLRSEFSEFTFHLWIEPLELVSFDGRVLIVRAPQHALSWVEETFLPALTGAVRAIAGEDAAVELASGPAARAAAERSEIAAARRTRRARRARAELAEEQA